MKEVMPLSHFKAFVVAGVHYLVSLGVGFLVLAIAWGLALSDAYQSDVPLRFFSFVLAVLQAPMALTLWLRALTGKFDPIIFEIPTLAMLSIPSSLLYGYAIAFFSRKKRHRRAKKWEAKCPHEA